MPSLCNVDTPGRSFFYTQLSRQLCFSIFATLESRCYFAVGKGMLCSRGEELCGGAPGLSGMEGELGQGCSPRALCFEAGGG